MNVSCGQYSYVHLMSQVINGDGVVDPLVRQNHVANDFMHETMMSSWRV